MPDLPLETAVILAERAPLEQRISELNDQITALQRELAPLWRRSKVLRDELVRRSYLVGCPKCGVGAEVPCRNLQNGQSGEKKWPHDARYEAFATVVGADGLELFKEY